MRPFIAIGFVAQDAIPLIVAGEMLPSHPDQIYIDKSGTLSTPPPIFTERFCDLVPPERDCYTVTTAFVSTPLALPLVRLLAVPAPDVGILLLRSLAAASLVGGMVLVWRMHASRVNAAPLMLTCAAAALTPSALQAIDLGQTSPVLFLCALLYPAAGGRPWLRVGVWVVTIAFKGFALVLAPLLLISREWASLVRAGVLLGGLVAAALLLGPVHLWADFLGSASALSGGSAENGYNSSVEAFVWRISGADISGVVSIGTALRVAILVCIPYVWRRIIDEPTRWSVALLASLLLLPQVWWHYIWVAPAAIAVTLAAPGTPARLFPAFPIAAGLSLPLGVINLSAASHPVPQFLYLVGSLALVLWISQQTTDDHSSEVIGPRGLASNQ